MPDVLDDFLLHYYNSQVWAGNTRWLGVPVLKLPLDLWLYQEIIFELKPDLIIETGTFNGGSALYLASICDLVGHGQVLSIDVAPQPNLPRHPRLSYLKTSSISEEAMLTVQDRLEPGDRVLAILDSDHRYHHVLAEMRLYSRLVTRGSYLIVEDTCANGHPVLPDWGPGPMEAVEAFLQESNGFEVDESKHKFFVSFSPRGYLRKIIGP